MQIKRARVRVRQLTDIILRLQHSVKIQTCTHRKSTAFNPPCPVCLLISLKCVGMHIGLTDVAAVGLSGDAASAALSRSLSPVSFLPQ